MYKKVRECPTFHVILAVGSRRAGHYKEVFYNKGDGNKKGARYMTGLAGEEKRKNILAGK